MAASAKPIVRASTFLASLLLVFAAGAYGQSACYAMADGYYEQVYCELQARGEAGSLPPMFEFKRNDATTQALLLRRPAERAGIEVPMPRQQADTPRTRPALAPLSPEPEPARATSAPAEQVAPAQALAGCELAGTVIHCPSGDYQLLGNRNNRHLAPNALEPENAMALPEFDGNMDDPAAVNRYLHRAYERYIDRMLAIGLGGVTMSYGRFAYLFEDLHNKGLDFGARFETMYRFLKQDKASMSVSEQPVMDNRLTIADCDFLNRELFVCSRGGRNYVFGAP